MKKGLTTIGMALVIGLGGHADAQLPSRELPLWVKSYLTMKGLDYSPIKGAFDPEVEACLDSRNALGPWSVTEDFDGDGVDDFAALLRRASGSVSIVAFLNRGSATSHHLLVGGVQSEDSDHWVYVVSRGAGRIEPRWGSEGIEESLSFELKNPGIEVVYFGKAAVVFYWSGSQFFEVPTAD